MLNGLCLDDDYTIAQWLEHRWLQAKVPGSSPGGDSQFFLQTFPVCLFPSNQLIIIIIILVYVPKGTHANEVTKSTAAEREKR